MRRVEETLHVDQWAKRLGLSPKTLKSRIYRGWSDEDVLFIPLHAIPTKEVIDNKVLEEG